MSRNKRHASYLEMPRDELVAKIADQESHIADLRDDLHAMKEALNQINHDEAKQRGASARYCVQCHRGDQETPMTAPASVCDECRAKNVTWFREKKFGST